jgi:hexosaminidase
LDIYFSWFVGYPELATEPGPYQIETRWGVMKPTMDPTKESTYTFLDKFFQEMTALFPDPYFHIGGDEVEGSKWAQSKSIRKFIVEQQLENKNGLQAYFNRRIQTMLKKYDKIMIGWEEILHEVSQELAVDKDAIIQAWMGRKALLNAIDRGYRGLRSHGYYLDHLRTSSHHYSVDPIVMNELKPFNEEQQSRILGGEACMWAEYVSEDTVDSRIWPRVLAIAERFWSPASIKDENSLYERLFRMNHLLDKMQIGLTHLSSYKLRLENLILDPNLKMSLLHPLTILADVCEPRSYSERSDTGRYLSTTPLTTFVDALQSESELIWKLGILPIDDQNFRKIFQAWSFNSIRLQTLFDDVGNNNNNKQLWGQDLEQLSKNLAQTGRIGLRILDYKIKKVFHPDQNHTMNSWTLSHWISHYREVLAHLEYQVKEVRLAAIRPIQRLLDSISNAA